jgi:L-lactate dehydrogenase complex protein LldG
MSKGSIDTGASRTRILNRLGATLAAGKDREAREKAVQSRLKRHKRNLVPERAGVEGAERIALFRDQAEAVAATVVEVESTDMVPQAIAEYLRERNLPARLRHGSDARLAELPWHKTLTLERNSGPARDDDIVSLSHAFAGVAETGTLILTSGADNPTTLNFLPENHIVVLDAADLGGSYEDAWDRVRKAYGAGKMPRTVNMISGPSRTADVEQTIQLGAHGPRALHVIIVNRG